LLRKPEEKILLGTSRRRRKEIFKMDLQEVGCGGHGLDGSGWG
jgi:hypothetical protein